MKRPSDQVKLLFLALLRGTVTTTGLATSSETSKNLLKATSPFIQFRLATRTDVPSIQRCNLATLPENYNTQFYVNQLRQWPNLAIVAEQVDENDANSARSRMRLYHGHPFGGMLKNPQPEPNIVAYVLGKVDHHQHRPHDPELIGHVTSLAVMNEYRRKGLAGSLMGLLHTQMLNDYDVQSVGLHVRKSNLAAVTLYHKDGYVIDQVIPAYYHDGEDAYFMRKPLDSRERNMPQLPLRMELAVNEGLETPELLTGTM